MGKPMEVYSTSWMRDWFTGSRAELRKHGCEVIDEEDKRVRVKWPKGTVLDAERGVYTLPDGWTVKPGR